MRTSAPTLKLHARCPKRSDGLSLPTKRACALFSARRGTDRCALSGKAWSPARRVKVVSVLVVLLVAMTTACSVRHTKPELVGRPKAPRGANTFKIGDEVRLGDWTVKVYGAVDRQVPRDPAVQPAAGTRWVGVDVQARIVSGHPNTSVLPLCFALRDSRYRDYPIDVDPRVNPEFFPTIFGPGRSWRRVVIFEVPDDAMRLQLIFACDVAQTGRVLIALS